MIARPIRFRAAAFAGLLAGAGAIGPAQAATSSDLRGYALTLANRDRAENGLPPLRLDPQLNAAAEIHAADMRRRDYFAHESPEGDTAFDRYIDAGGSQWVSVAENLSRCQHCGRGVDRSDLDRAEQGWMDSPGHRANLLDPSATSFGFAIVGGGDVEYAVQTFAGPGPERETEAGGPATPLSPEARGALALDRINQARRSERAPPLAASAALTVAARDLAARLGASDAAPDLSGNALSDALPTGQEERWRSLSMLSLQCGGCGVVATDADVEHAVASWTSDRDYVRTLLGSRFADVGFALTADGRGRKIAVAVFGERR